MRIGAEGGTRTPTSYLTRPSNVRVYQFRHFGLIRRDFKQPGVLRSRSIAIPKIYFFVGCGEDVITVETGVGVGNAVVAWAVGVGCGASVTPDCKTELVPLIAGSDKIKAMSMNAAAAPIVILASSVCVPRGPKAVLETELLNNAPASALPGCNRMTRIKTTQARINNP